MHTHAEIKRLVVGDRKPSQSPRLFLSEHDGELYATNSHWLTPAKAVAPLLEHNNLPTDKPGVYAVNSKLTTQDTEPPNVGQLMPQADAEIIHRSRLNGEGSPLYVKPANRLLALFDRADGTQAAFDAEYLAFIDNDGELGSIPCGYGSRFIGEPIYRQAGALKVLAVYAKREKQASTPDDRPGHYAKQTWTDDGETFLGLLMPVRI